MALIKRAMATAARTIDLDGGDGSGARSAGAVDESDDAAVADSASVRAAAARAVERAAVRAAASWRTACGVEPEGARRKREGKEGKAPNKTCDAERRRDGARRHSREHSKRTTEECR